MRITISSPDGLGDFVLRMPLFEALCDAGHDLQIFMRPPALELAAAVLPAARIEKISEDPYARLVRFRRNPFDRRGGKIGTFAPDLFVIAPFQHSFFDEICLSKLPKRLRVIGFRSADAFWGTLANTAPQELANRFAMWVEVKADIPELEKNRLLACAILGSGRSKQARRESLRHRKRSTMPDRFFGNTILAKAEYWVVCAGSRPGLEIKDWGEANWIAALSQIASETQAPFLFLGNEAEAPSIERIRSGLPRVLQHFNLRQDPPSIAGHLRNHCAVGRLCGTRLGPHAPGGRLRSARFLAISSGWLWGRFFPETRRCRHCLAGGALPGMPWLLPFGRAALRSARHRAAIPGRDGNSSEARVHETRIVEIPMDANLRKEIVETAHRRFPRLAHDAQRQVFESGRAVNLLDSAGLGLRALARRNYRRKLGG